MGWWKKEKIKKEKEKMTLSNFTNNEKVNDRNWWYLKKRQKKDIEKMIEQYFSDLR